MNTKDYWKIFNTDKSVMILTDCPKDYDVYKLMKPLQKIYGFSLCSTQKFDDRFDKIEDFNIILKTGYNFDGNRLICAHLFAYNPETNLLLVDNKKFFKIVADNDGYVYRIQKTQIKCQNCWDGLRKHILWTMGDDSCSRFWGDAQFGEQEIIPLERKKIGSELAEVRTA